MDSDVITLTELNSVLMIAGTIILAIILVAIGWAVYEEYKDYRYKQQIKKSSSVSRGKR